MQKQKVRQWLSGSTMRFNAEIPGPLAEPGRLLVGGRPDETLRKIFPQITEDELRANAELGERAIREIESEGIDVLAYYRSFRNRDWWGIAIKRSAILGIGAKLFSLAGGDAFDCLKTAYSVLYEHERFHFQVDCAYLRVECWSALSTFVDPWNYDGSLYGRSRASLVNKGALSYDPLEEAIANARAVYALKQPRLVAYQEPIKQILRRSPSGYRDFEKFGSKKELEKGLDALIPFDSVLNPNSRIWSAEGFSKVINLRQSIISNVHVPVYILEYE